ncbi:MAG: Nudix family hydrolase [Pseudomonadota bacterium]
MESEQTPATITVVAAVLRDGEGRVLMAQRPAGKDMAGKWELPGGKVKAGEGLHDALAREIAEELGAEVTASRPLLQLAHTYPSKRVVLHAREAQWRGTIGAREGQGLRWMDPRDRPAFEALDLLEADGPIVTAMRLPSRYLITPPALVANDVPAFLDRALRSQVGLVQLRVPTATTQELALLAAAFANGVERLARRDERAPAWVIGGASPQTTAPLVQRYGAAGVHLPARFLDRLDAVRAQADREGWDCLLTSCHDAQELIRARDGGADAAVLGPVLPTPSHPGVAGLGWEPFEALLRDLALPVYAIGGVGDGLMERAWACGAQGVAGISAIAPT